MPGWHEKLKSHVEKGEVVELGLIQEQHPDRCKLFMQWKQMDWPIMVDSLNLLAVKVVPITLFIDESGIIRKVKPKHEELAAFLGTDYDSATDAPAKVEKPDAASITRQMADVKKTDLNPEDVAWATAVADNAFLWLEPEESRQAYNIYNQLLKLDETVAVAQFRAGVALRRAYDFGDGGTADFAKAVSHWERSLELDPNHYIRRRRIQQYGPRLDKPYSFYDWVNSAREEITARGEDPVKLVVEPSGAEFAYPEKDFKEGDDQKNPDPEAKINADSDKLIDIASVAVPAKIKAGGATRIHLTLKVNRQKSAHWNNESGDSVVWVEAPAGWQLENQLLTLPVGKGATSTEERKVEFEARAPKDAKPGRYKLKGYALYFVCEGVDGTCLYLRQDIELDVEVS